MGPPGYASYLTVLRQRHDPAEELDVKPDAYEQYGRDLYKKGVKEYGDQGKDAGIWVKEEVGSHHSGYSAGGAYSRY